MHGCNETSGGTKRFENCGTDGFPTRQGKQACQLKSLPQAPVLVQIPDQPAKKKKATSGEAAMWVTNTVSNKLSDDCSGCTFAAVIVNHSRNDLMMPLKTL